MIKQEYIEKLTAERQNVLSAVEGLNDEELSQPMAEGKWSVKDTLGHLAAWEGEAIRAFEQKARGERPTIGDITDFNAWNEVESAKRKDRTAEEIRREIAGNRERLLAILNDLPDEGNVWAPERMTARLVDMLIQHDQHHAKTLHEYRRAKSS
jgi:uncharacterized damage-inducible protein DinB